MMTQWALPRGNPENHIFTGFCNCQEFCRKLNKKYGHLTSSFDPLLFVQLSRRRGESIVSRVAPHGSGAPYGRGGVPGP